MAAGRPAIPSALKMMDGTYRTDRAIENEMMPSKMIYAPSAPKGLSADAKKVWASVCGELIELDMLHRVDLELLAAYCNEMAAYWHADKQIKKLGYTITIETKYASYDQVSPWVGIRNTALKNSQALANQFGFTPAARTRINAVPKDDTDPLATLIAAKKNRNKNEDQ